MAHELYGDAVTSEGSDEAKIQLTIGAQEKTYEVSPTDTSVESTLEEKPEGATEEAPLEVPPEEARQDSPEEAGEKTSEETLQADVESLKSSEEELAKDLKSKGLDFTAMADEFTANGELSPETLAKLAENGYPKVVVDSIIAGRQAVEQRFATAVHSLVGGEEQFNTLQEFAASNLSAQEVASFNRAIESDDLGVIGLMLKGIQAKYTTKHGTKGKPVIGATTGTPKAQGFKDNSEMVKAMSDKRYGRDAAYTNEVIQKVAASNI
ncbi:Phage capsid and scaffold [Pseudomonas chlororaphis subsp. piscium]|uniref:capsid assembly protein n=1 Tax=Pseudomonas chlororaphis TaxID=587753 RepID=UPI000F582BE2|nr:hypothetical protein [Pseudomonas chlororaphis]AZC49492.1 Phage capsid and scaffold [Pseudomonas chlororaphis subsp. piscium]